MRNLVLALTGASGSIYALRLLEVLIAAGRRVHVTFSPAAADVCEHELGLKLSVNNFDPQVLLQPDQYADPKGPWQHVRLTPVRPPHGSSVFSDSEIYTGSVVYHHYQDFRAGIASGSFLTEGMVVCPCSGGTLASIATGQCSNLIHRAAEVHMKERRKLIIVPRETPLSGIALANMKTLSDQGVIILPAMPGFYQHPKTMQDLVDFVVARICDQLDVKHELMPRWGVEEHATDTTDA